MNARARAGQGIVTDVNPTPGILQRLRTAYQYVSTGTSDWFGPREPLPVVAPPEVAGRALDYNTGYNQNLTPRALEPVSFSQLRTLADAYDLMRVIIETRKDQVSRVGWNVKPRDQNQQPDARCKKINEFLLSPDRDHDWDVWVRALIEDMLVIDAATIYPRKTRGGELYSLDLVDGATIKRVIGEDGRTPLPPAVAYQQILKGVPAGDFTRDELLYRVRNWRVHRIYGFSPVEQVITTVNIALRRQMHQLQYYTEGNVPEALIGVPENWTTEQIRQFQEYWDVLLEGNTAKRRHAKFVPGGMQYQPTKDSVLKDMYDEWLARVVCFAFSVSPNAFIAQVNRATAEVSQESALQEGLAPVLAWVKNTMDTIIRLHFNAPDLQFDWAEEKMVDPSARATIHKTYIDARVMTPDEVREELGMDALTPEQREQLAPAAPAPLAPEEEVEEDEGGDEDEEEGVDKAEGFKPPAGVRSAARRGLELRRKWKRGGLGNSEASDKGIGSGVQRAVNLANGDSISLATIKRMAAFFARHQKNYQPDKKEPDGGPTAGTIAWLLWGGNAGKSWANGILSRVKKALDEDLDDEVGEYLGAMLKRSAPRPKAARPIAPINRGRRAAQKAEKAIRSATEDALAAVLDEVLEAVSGIAKEDDGLAQRIADALKLIAFDDLAKKAGDILAALAADGGEEAMRQLGISDEKMLELVNEQAVAWAQRHAAELVGKKWVDGKLVDNPNAVYRIDEKTREGVQSLVQQAIDEGWSNDRLAKALRESYTFSKERADLIAVTETAFADVQGNVIAYRESGMVKGKKWIVGSAEKLCPTCADNQAQGVIAFESQFSSGNFAPPAHPRCRCDIVPVLTKRTRP